MSHDSGYKLLFSHPEMVKDLLTGFVHDDWVGQCDFDSLEKVNGSYVSDDLRSREDDAIWRIRWGDDWLYLYLLLEFQSTVDHFMAVRILNYVSLLYQDLIRSERLTSRDKLPPVLPIVLYNGETRWRAPVNLQALMHLPPKGLEAFQPQASYLLLDEGSYGNAELSRINNLVSALFQLENSRGSEDIREVLKCLLEWLKAPEQTSLRRAFTVWIGRVLLPAKAPSEPIKEFNDLQEVHTMLAERVKQWVQEWKEEGLQEGLQEGRQKGLQEGRQKGLQEGIREGIREGLEQGRQQGIQIGEAKTLLKLITLKFGPAPDWVVNKVSVADKEQLDVWVERVITAKSVEQLLS